MPLTIRTESKSSANYNADPRIRSIDELQRIATESRDDFLGDDWANEAKRFYSMEGLLGKAPSFRPQVQIPQLQMLSVSEATDLTDSSPKVYIYNKQEICENFQSPHGRVGWVELRWIGISEIPFAQVIYL